MQSLPRTRRTRPPSDSHLFGNQDEKSHNRLGSPPDQNVSSREPRCISVPHRDHHFHRDNSRTRLSGHCSMRVYPQLLPLYRRTSLDYLQRCNTAHRKGPCNKSVPASHSSQKAPAGLSAHTRRCSTHQQALLDRFCCSDPILQSSHASSFGRSQFQNPSTGRENVAAMRKLQSRRDFRWGH